MVLTPRAGLPLGPVEPFAEFLERRVTVVNLEELSQRRDLEPLEELLTLVVRQEPDLGPPASHYLVEAVTKPLAGGDHGDRRNPAR